MNIAALMHVPFETPAAIGEWATARHHELTEFHLYDRQSPPAIDDFDWLVTLGGPISVHDVDTVAFLAGEKQFLRRAIDAGKVCVGTCLGAQLLAEALGATVASNRQTEIGWYEVRLTEEGKSSDLLAGVPAAFPAPHWHGETFGIPPRALRLAESDATDNQAFYRPPNVLGLQFHPEYTSRSLELMVEHCSHELVDGPYVQSAGEILTAPERTRTTHAVLFSMLDQLAAINGCSDR